jgi:hypothetical protein
VLAGFKEIPGIGDKTSQAIVDFKEKVEVERWDGLIGVPGIGKKTIEKMREFSLKDDPFDIHKIERETKAIREWLRREGLPMPNTLATDIPFEAQRSSHIVLGLLKDKQPQDMYENVRARTGEELDPKTVKDPELSAYMTMFLEDTHGRITLKVNRWTYPKYRDDIDNAIINQDYVLAKAVKKPYHGRSIHATRLYIINPDD